MPVLSDREWFGPLFVERTHHAPLVIVADQGTGSRIGGRAPEAVSVPERSGQELTYFFTLGSDVLGTLIDPIRELSFFYLRDASARLGGTPGSGPDLLTVVLHAASKRSAAERTVDSPLQGRSLELGQLLSDQDKRGAIPLDSKCGGAPGLIQDEESYLRHVNERGLEFLLQISEESFPDDMLARSYFFYYGEVYIFTKFDKVNRRIDPALVGSFFQH